MNNHFEKIRLIVADLDGTLLHDDKTMDEHIKECVNELQKIGIQFTLATGRNVHIMKSFIDELHIALPCITNNGANMYKQGQCIYERDMEHDELLFAFQILNKYALPFIAYTADAVYTKDSTCASLQSFLERLKGKSKIIDGFDEGMEIPLSIFKVVIIPSDQTCMNEVATIIHDNCKNLQCVRSEDEIFTMTHIDATKGKTLLTLLTQEKLQSDEVMVFGDNFNDISMFKAAGIAIAMGNAHAEVKAQADYVAESNNDNGVSLFIHENLLNKR